MSNLAVKEVNFNGDILMAAQDKTTEKVYVGVRWICEGIGLTVDQAKRQIKNIREDVLLNQGFKKLVLPTNGGEQKVTCLEVKYLPIWLSKINSKSLNELQYQKLIRMLNFLLSTDFEDFKIPTKIYQWEGELRDEIYNIGYFENYKIIDKEVAYSFGRVDLLAKNESDELVVIELKKHKNYNDVIDQCNKYIKGFKEELNKDIRTVVCTLDNDPLFIKKAIQHNIEVYKYERKLELHKMA